MKKEINKIVIYSDVHGNFDALKNLYHSEDYKTADLKIFLGDAVAMAPYPNECLEAIYKSDDIFCMGNHDSYMAFGMPKEEVSYFKKDKLEHQYYMWNKTKKSFKEKLKGLSKSYTITTQNKKMFFTHYIWKSDNIIADELKDISLPNIKKLFKNIDANYIFYGHEHKESFFEDLNTTYIGVGSLGMKYPGNYTVVNIIKNQMLIEQKKLIYDIVKLKKEIIKEDYPRAKSYASWFDE